MACLAECSGTHDYEGFCVEHIFYSHGQVLLSMGNSRAWLEPTPGLHEDLDDSPDLGDQLATKYHHWFWFSPTLH